MKTLPEILTKHITDFNIRDNGGMNDTENVMLCNQEAQEAIAKELMGCLPAKLKYDVAVALRDGSYIRGQEKKVEGYNKALDEVRARLTAFLGHKEK